MGCRANDDDDDFPILRCLGWDQVGLTLTTELDYLAALTPWKDRDVNGTSQHLPQFFHVPSSLQVSPHKSRIHFSFPTHPHPHVPHVPPIPSSSNSSPPKTTHVWIRCSVCNISQTSVFPSAGYCDQQPVCPSRTFIQGGSNMTGTDLYVNKPHCAAAVRPWESEAKTSTLPPARVRTCSVLSGSC